MLKRTALLVGLLLTTVSVTRAQERQPDIRDLNHALGGLNSLLSSGYQLLSSADVQKELAITDAQKPLIEGIRQKLRDAYAANRKNAVGSQDLQNMSEEERFRFMKNGEEIWKQVDEMISTILEPEQIQRLQQLKLQREGAAAFSREEVLAKLDITDEQRGKILKILQDARQNANAAIRTFQRAPADERRELVKKTRQNGENAIVDIIGLLTPEQKSNWEQVQGKKFDFSSLKLDRNN